MTNGGTAGIVSGGTRVYVGNLSWETSWQDLKDHFRAAGDVSHADVMQEHDGRSKGCGIVSFVSARGAAQAIAMLNQSELGGRVIFVREARAPPRARLPPPHGTALAATTLPRTLHRTARRASSVGYPPRAAACRGSPWPSRPPRRSWAVACRQRVGVAAAAAAAEAA